MNNNCQVIELKPHEREALLNKFDAPRARVFQKIVSPELKVKDPAAVDESITAAAVLQDAKGIVARALARGALKIVPDRNGSNTRNYAHKTGRRWTTEQRAARSEMLRTPDSGLQTQK